MRAKYNKFEMYRNTKREEKKNLYISQSVDFHITICENTLYSIEFYFLYRIYMFESLYIVAVVACYLLYFKCSLLSFFGVVFVAGC